MKTLARILILIGVVVLTFQCTRSKEEIMATEINNSSLYNRSKIISVDVLDTIYQKDVELALKMDTIRLEFLKRHFERLSSTKDSVRRLSRLNNNDTIVRKYVRSVFDSISRYERWTEMVNKKSQMYEELYDYYYSDTADLRGYRVLVHYKDGRTNDFIITDKYQVICPSFMIEVNDSMFNFRPNMMIKRPDKMDINSKLHRFDKQPDGIQQRISR